LQASGKSIQDAAAEADEAADYEIAELFEDIGAAASDDDDLADVAESVEGDDSAN
jgi:large subunit ribosomal protein L9